MSFPALLFKLILAGGLLVGGGMGALAADGHDHGHSRHASGLTLNKGAKWRTDAPLRQGMQAIRDDVALLLPRLREGTLPKEDIGRLADKIDHHVQFMVANCKLPPEADGQLHIVIGHIAEGAEGMKKGKEGRKAVEAVIEALDAYARHFDHPGWKPPA
ncbi:MAG: hypothetical protein H7841_15400 [Magnetospirillum sp. WYHS-4]